MQDAKTMQLVPQLLTYEHAAKLTDLTPRQVRTLVATGKLAVTKVGRYPRVRADELADFIERNTARAAEVTR